MDRSSLEGRLADRDVWRAGDRCSIGRAMEVVGTRSAMLLMREAFYGTRRFDDFAARVGITEAVAAKRLRELVDAGLLQRAPYREPGQRTRHEYRAHRDGPRPRARPRWPSCSGATPTWPTSRVARCALRHSGCGADVAVEVRCTEGHEVPLEEISVRVRRRTA